jgi:hypothetical protein
MIFHELKCTIILTCRTALKPVEYLEARTLQTDVCNRILLEHAVGIFVLVVMKQMFERIMLFEEYDKKIIRKGCQNNVRLKLSIFNRIGASVSICNTKLHRRTYRRRHLLMRKPTKKRYCRHDQLWLKNIDPTTGRCFHQHS